MVTAAGVAASLSVSATGAAATILGIGAGIAIGAMGVALLGYGIWKLCATKKESVLITQRWRSAAQLIKWMISLLNCGSFFFVGWFLEFGQRLLFHSPKFPKKK